MIQMEMFPGLKGESSPEDSKQQRASHKPRFEEFGPPNRFSGQTDSQTDPLLSLPLFGEDSSSEGIFIFKPSILYIFFFFFFYFYPGIIQRIPVENLIGCLLPSTPSLSLSLSFGLYLIEKISPSLNSH